MALVHGTALPTSTSLLARSTCKGFSHRFVAGALLLTLAVPAIKANAQTNQTPPPNSHGKVLGTPQSAVDDFGAIAKILKVYRDSHNGQYPDSNGPLILDMMQTPGKYGYRNFAEARAAFTNPDFLLHNLDITPERAESASPYIATYKRADGSPLGGPRPAGSRDLLDWTDIYYYRNAVTFPDGGTGLNPVGYYITLWEDGTVEKIPFDLALFTTDAQGKFDFSPSFPGQVNTSFNTLSYAERYGEDAAPGKPTPSPDQDAPPDNGGPEALLQLSRRLAIPSTYGLDRDTLWQAFDPTYANFKLSDLQSVSAPLGLQTQVKTLSLDQLRALNAPAVIALKDTGRLVALLALDADRALIVDQGVPQNIGITGLAAQYGGEALVPSAALAPTPTITVTDPVRTVALPSLDAEVAQQVTLHNTGNKPVTLSLDYPLLGVTDAQLNKTTLAPGDSATLALKMKWRPSLKTPTQNVLVTVRTDSPAAPRLQLAFLLTPPQQ